MAESRRGLRRRIIHLTEIRPHGWRAVFTAILLAGILFLLTAPARTEAPALQEPGNVQNGPATKSAATDSKAQFKAVQVKLQVKILEVPSSMANTDEALPASGLIFGRPGLRYDPGDGRTQLLGIFPKADFQTYIRKLNKLNGIDLMSAPTVTTRSGMRVTAGIVREFRYPAEYGQPAAGSHEVIPKNFVTKNLGLTIESVPTFEDSGTINLNFHIEMTNFDGFKDIPGNRILKQPVFSTRAVTAAVEMGSGDTAAFIGSGLEPKLKAVIFGDSSDQHPATPGERALIIFVTAIALDAEGNPKEGHKHISESFLPDAFLSAPVKSGERFYGVPVFGKRGFVTSPYAPESGYVDVRGYAAGSEARDPYTGQIFLVPSPDGSVPPEPLPDPSTPMGKALR